MQVLRNEYILGTEAYLARVREAAPEDALSSEFEFAIWVNYNRVLPCKRYGDMCA